MTYVDVISSGTHVELAAGLNLCYKPFTIKEHGKFT